MEKDIGSICAKKSLKDLKYDKHEEGIEGKSHYLISTKILIRMILKKILKTHSEKIKVYIDNLRGSVCLPRKLNNREPIEGKINLRGVQTLLYSQFDLVRIVLDE